MVVLPEFRTFQSRPEAGQVSLVGRQCAYRLKGFRLPDSGFTAGNLGNDNGQRLGMPQGFIAQGTPGTIEPGGSICLHGLGRGGKVQAVYPAIPFLEPNKDMQPGNDLGAVRWGLDNGFAHRNGPFLGAGRKIMAGGLTLS